MFDGSPLISQCKKAIEEEIQKHRKIINALEQELSRRKSARDEFKWGFPVAVQEKMEDSDNYYISTGYYYISTGYRVFEDRDAAYKEAFEKWGEEGPYRVHKVYL